MSPERAEYLLKNTVNGTLRYSFKPSHRRGFGITYIDGITEDEDGFLEVANLSAPYLSRIELLREIASGKEFVGLK